MGTDSGSPLEERTLSASLDGPSKTIVVEPVRQPVPAPPAKVEPEPARQPAEPRQPAR
jgi:hypothetical protein